MLESGNWRSGDYGGDGNRRKARPPPEELGFGAARLSWILLLESWSCDEMRKERPRGESGPRSTT